MTGYVYNDRTACWMHASPDNPLTVGEVKAARRDVKHCMQGPVFPLWHDLTEPCTDFCRQLLRCQGIAHGAALRVACHWQAPLAAALLSPFCLVPMPTACTYRLQASGAWASPAGSAARPPAPQRALPPVPSRP